MNPILELSHVSYTYSKDTPFEVEALSDVSLSFEKGLITGVIGHTGSGKSTLVQMLNGLLKPGTGCVLLNGEDIYKNPKNLPKIRFRIGLVMQYPEYQLFDETVRADIGYGPRNMGLSPEEIEERVNEAADFAFFPKELLDRSPFELSGGQKRRAAIAGVIAMRPEVLVLDEPAAGLDPLGKKEILSGLRRYRDMSGATVIIVSHSMEDMAEYCDSIAVMNRGRLYTQGTPEEVFAKAENLTKVGLDVPEISRVAMLLREKGIVLPTVYTVDGMEKAILALLNEGGKKEC